MPKLMIFNHFLEKISMKKQQKPIFRFEMNELVMLGNAQGRVTGRADYARKEPTYFIEFESAADGQDNWYDESSLSPSPYDTVEPPDDD